MNNLKTRRVPCWRLGSEEEETRRAGHRILVRQVARLDSGFTGKPPASMVMKSGGNPSLVLTAGDLDETTSDEA